MPKPIIAIDIDDVLAASAAAWVAESNARWGTNLKPEDYDEDWTVMWNLDHETTKQRAKELFETVQFSNFKHDETALEVLEELARDYTLVIATSRRNKIRQQSLEWLDKHFPNIFSDFHTSGIFDDPQEGAYAITKAELLESIKADYLIDDQPKHCIAAADVGKQAILFGDYSWNREAKILKGVRRCKDWPAVLKYFNDRY